VSEPSNIYGGAHIWWYASWSNRASPGGGVSLPRTLGLLMPQPKSRGSEAASYLRRVDSCIAQLGTQGPCRTCNESQEEEEVNPDLL
jgi:hypothetical protein